MRLAHLLMKNAAHFPISISFNHDNLRSESSFSNVIRWYWVLALALESAPALALALATGTGNWHWQLALTGAS